MENKGYLIYEVGILGGNDKVKTNLFVLFVPNVDKIEEMMYQELHNDTVQKV